MTKLVKLETISLKDHSEINETCIQDFIFEHPEVLGSDELSPVSREKKQPNGGRMKLPGLTPGVSFVPKSQLRLILPATNRQEENSVFLWQDLHSSPRLHTGYSVRYKKDTRDEKNLFVPCA